MTAFFFFFTFIKRDRRLTTLDATNKIRAAADFIDLKYFSEKNLKNLERTDELLAIWA